MIRTGIGRPRVVIVGAGFGGLQAAKSLKHAPVEVVLIDRRNYHLFQPFLYQVATASLAGSDIATPIRYVLKRQKNAQVVMGEVTGVSSSTKQVHLTGQRSIEFDYLILATGSRHSYFGNDSWEEFAPGLKSILDATEIRSRLLTSFEKAEFEKGAEHLRKLMTVILVGGGPTGVEIAGSIATLFKRILKNEFRQINPSHARIILLEAGSRILNTFPENLSAKAKKELEVSGVEVRTNTRVIHIDSKGVHLQNEVIAAETILWTAGVAAASPLGQWLNVKTDPSGRVRVRGDLSIPDHPEIFVIGDATHVLGQEGKLVPGLAPAAIQEGRYVAQLIQNKIIKRPNYSVFPFQYRDKGNLATLGKLKAVADFDTLRFAGFFAWILWAMVHIAYLVTFRNRFIVLLKWAFLFSTFQARDRLILTPETPSHPIDLPPINISRDTQKKAS